jgi:signal transduction histidine kinase/DNA-binding response OmpR family regulator/ligand-binding sensor domain-containing protein
MPFARLILILSICACFGAEVSAQEPLFQQYQRFDTENGLPQSYVTGITQDDDGFLWVSTMEGIGRFDGKDFLRFVHNPADTASISTNRIGALTRDVHNGLWLLHEDKTVERFDARTFRATPRQAAILEGDQLRFTAALIHRNLMCRDINGNLLIQQGNNFRLFDGSSNPLFEKFARATGTTPSLPIFAYHLGADGILWLLTRQGLERIDHVEAHPLGVGLGEEIRKWNLFQPSMLVDMDGRILVGGPGTVHSYDPGSGTWDLIELPEFPGQTPYVISKFCKSSDGQLFFEYKGHVMRLDHQGRVSVIWKMPSPFAVSTIFIDKTNSLWVGTNPDGLYRINLNALPFQKFAMRKNFISDVIMDQYDVPAIQADAFKFGITKAYYLRYYQRDSASIVMTLENQMENPGILLLRKGSLKRIQGLGYVDSFAAGLDGRPLVLENQDLVRLDLNGNAQRERTTLPITTDQLIVEMEMDGTSLWMATIKEIFELKDNAVVNSRTMTDGYPICTIKNDPNDHQFLWVGTLGGGLYKIDKESLNTVATYTIGEGLPNNTINAIVPDSAGNLWISTNKGISRFAPKEQLFVNFTTADGLHETEFNRYHHLRLPDGRIAFGGSRGYTVFDPTLFRADTLQPAVILTKLTVNGDERMSATPLAMVEKIEFEYTENSIGFELAAIQFNSPEKNKFRYRLVGVDADWIDNGTDRRIRYNQLPSGNYTLELNASNTAGVWSSAVRRIELIIHPPIWQTGWAYAIYSVLLIGGFGTIWNTYKVRLKARQEAAFNLREAQRWREVDEVKTRFFSNITHEFRTPLTLILTPLEKYLDEEGLPEKVHTLLRNNHRHASKLLQLVNQLLDIAKLEAGQMPVHATRGQIDVFISDCIHSFQEEADRKSIALSLEMRRTEDHYLFDKDKLEKVLANLLSNAIKFTPDGGRVVCLVEVQPVEGGEKEQLTLRVTDSGIGIDETKRLRVFERFYQADDSSVRKHEGTGIGLALVRELVVLMGGTIALDSEVGKGTKVTVLLPIKKLSALERSSDHQEIVKAPVREVAVNEGAAKPVILVTEDNDELRSFLVENLSESWTVLESADGIRAWELMTVELPEVVISDVMMPGISGTELCKRAKGDPRTSHIGFIMLTAKASQESRIAGFEAGADEYVTKPFHLYELQLRIRNLFQKQENLRRHLQQVFSSPTPEVAPPPSDPFLDKVFLFLNQNLADPGLNVEKLAEAMAMSKSTLNRKFRIVVDKSPNDFIRQYRLNQALRLLDGSITVADVSQRVGFESPSYFTQCFREQYGLTPTAVIQEKNSPSTPS